MKMPSTLSEAPIRPQSDEPHGDSPKVTDSTIRGLGDLGSPLAGAPSTDDLRGSPNLIHIDGLSIERGHGEDSFVVTVPELRIERGSFTSILGPSGCGKTSLLFVLGLLRVSGEDSGFRIACEAMRFHLDRPLMESGAKEVVVFDGVDSTGGGHRLPAQQVEALRQRLIGFCLQGGELVPSLTLEENVAVPAHLGGFDHTRVRAGERLRSLDMATRLFEGLPSELSGGQNQRGVLARALVHDPPLILLDEPTSALDRATAVKAIELLRQRARERGQTVVMVTHDEVLAKEFSDQIVRMDNPGPGVGTVIDIADLEGDAEPAAESTQPTTEAEPRSQGVGGERDTADDASATADTAGEEREESTDRGVVLEPSAPPRGRAGLGYFLRLAWLDAVGPLANVAQRLIRRPIEASRGLGRRDSPLRRRSTYAFVGQLIKNSLIAVAIGLLILLLRGISSGMVEEFRQSLLKSPTARELTITPMGSTGALDSGALANLQASHPEIDLIIPQATQVVSLANPPTEGTSLTLAGTLPQDPKLAALYPEQDFSTFDSRSLIVSGALAEELGLGVGDPMQVWVSRVLDAEGRENETLPADLRVSHVIDGGDRKTAYAHLDLMGQISDYKAGRPVPDQDWLGFARAIDPRYESFLLFAKRPLSGREERVLASRGLVVVPIEAQDPRRSLYGLLKDGEQLKEERRSPLEVVEVRSGRQEGNLKWLDGSLATQVVDLLVDSDAVMLLWNAPRNARLDGQPVQLLGLSGSTRWLRGYLRHRRGVFPAREQGWLVAFGDRVGDPRQASLEVDLGGESLQLPFEAYGEPPASTVPSPEVFESGDPSVGSEAEPTPSQAEAIPSAVIPAALLSQLDLADEGVATADLGQKLFRPTAEETVYYQARVFVRDVFEVTTLHKTLSQGFGVRSNQARVREAQRYGEVLDLLVNILSFMALGIAFATIYVVFDDVTRRKQRMIGTLRILGLSRRGVLVILVIRGLLVALVASGLIFLVGQVIAKLLNSYHGQELCLLTPQDYLLVASGILVVCLAAVLVPAWKVARLDPVVALEEAKLNA